MATVYMNQETYDAAVASDGPPPETLTVVIDNDLDYGFQRTESGSTFYFPPEGGGLSADEAGEARLSTLLDIADPDDDEETPENDTLRVSVNQETLDTALANGESLDETYEVTIDNELGFGHVRNDDSGQIIFLPPQKANETEEELDLRQYAEFMAMIGFPVPVVDGKVETNFTEAVAL